MNTASEELERYWDYGVDEDGNEFRRSTFGDYMRAIAGLAFNLPLIIVNSVIDSRNQQNKLEKGIR